MKSISRLMAVAAMFAAGSMVFTASAAPKKTDAPAEKQAGEKGDATATLESARKAMKNLKAVSYTIKMNGAMNNVESTGEVTLVRADAGGWKVAAKGENKANPMHGKKEKDKEGDKKADGDAKTTPFEVAYDGATGHSIVEADKTVFQTSIKDETGLRNFFASQKAGWVVPWEMISTNPFTLSSNSGATLEGNTDVGGVNCDIVKIATKTPTTKGKDVMAHGGAVTTYYFGKDDHLLRRVDRAIGGETESGRSGEMVQSTVTLTNVQVDTAAVGANFAPAVPDGFIVKPVGGGAKKGDGMKEDKKEKSEGGAPGLLSIGSAAPDWALKTPSGDEVKLSALKGKVVVMDFWATWCPPCKAAMPHVQKLHEKFAGKDVKVFGLSTFEKGGDPAKYMADQKFTYGLVVKADSVATNYKVSGIPTFYIIGKDGKIIYNAVGFDESEFKTIESVINKELAKN